MSNINDIFKMIIENKEWLFSGIGNTIGSALINTGKNKKSVDSYITNVINYYNETEKDKKSGNHDLINNDGNEILQLVDRFISIYESHGVSLSQIAFFAEEDFNLKLADFKNKDSILNIMDNNFINWTCNVFGIQREWVEGKSKRIYKHINYYKEIHRFIDDICRLKELYSNDLFIFMMKNGELVDNELGEKYVTVILKYPIKKVNNNTIYRYVPISINWDWGYWRTRYQLKAIIYICENLNIDTNAYDMSIDTMYKIAGGLVFPKIEIDNIRNSGVWYPEDYISRGIQGKEKEELEQVVRYFEEEGYLKYLKEVKENINMIKCKENDDEPTECFAEKLY